LGYQPGATFPPSLIQAVSDLTRSLVEQKPDEDCDQNAVSKSIEKVSF
jgi:hypothetical protein